MTCKDCIKYDVCGRQLRKDYTHMPLETVCHCFKPKDMVEVRHGEWKWGSQNSQYGIWCTNCGAGWVNSENAEWIAKEHDYCPKCGAKMDGKGEGE